MFCTFCLFLQTKFEKPFRDDICYFLIFTTKVAQKKYFWCIFLDKPKKIWETKTAQPIFQTQDFFFIFAWKIEKRVFVLRKIVPCISKRKCSTFLWRISTTFHLSSRICHIKRWDLAWIDSTRKISYFWKMFWRAPFLYRARAPFLILFLEKVTFLKKWLIFMELYSACVVARTSYVMCTNQHW